MKPSIRIQIDYVHDGTRRDVLLLNINEIPPHMTAKKCAIWMLARATEQLTEPSEKRANAVD